VSAVPASSATREAVAERPDHAEATEYWEQTRRPFPCLLFLAPILILYEFGVLWLGGGEADALRNGADIWIRSGLHRAGLEHVFVLPVVVAGLLLIWNFYGYFDWRCRADTLLGMFAESVLFAFTLVVLGQFAEIAFREAGFVTVATSAELPRHTPSMLSRILAFVGAGIYEEVLFRLLLLPALYLGFRALQATESWATVLAVIASSFAFSLAHYIGPAGESIVPFTFAFRAAAGAFFATLFFSRGFGITVGTHAVYDLMVGVLSTGAQGEA